MDPNRPRTWRWMWSEAPPSPGRPSTRLPVVLRGERKTAQLRHLASREKTVEYIGTFVLVRSVGRGCRATMWIIWKSYYFSECHFFLSLHNLTHFRFFNFTDKFYKVRQKCYWFLNLQRHLIFSTQNYSTISCTYFFLLSQRWPWLLMMRASYVVGAFSIPAWLGNPRDSLIFHPIVFTHITLRGKQHE